jgi:hypothetical protein
LFYLLFIVRYFFKTSTNQLQPGVTNMKKITAIIPIILGLFFLGTNSAMAQLGDAGQILRAGKQDANTLLKAYFEPLGRGFGTGLNSGWFNTAKTHSTLGFDISLNASVAVVPAGDQSFDVQALTLTQLEYIEEQSQSPISPTAFGDNVSGPTMGAYYNNPFTGNRELLFDFQMPQGSGFNYVPAPMLQASVGIIKSTDITVRYVPESTYEDFSVSLWGVGIKHGLNQWLPGGKLLPVDISLQAGFTKMTSSMAFNVDPEQGANIKNDYDPSTWVGQQAEFTADAFTINALVGKTLPIISVYAGVGYETSTVSLGTPGSYPITVPNEDYNSPGDPQKAILAIEDPIDITYNKNDSFRALIGARIKLTIFHISASYTLSKYPVARVGFGFGLN